MSHVSQWSMVVADRCKRLILMKTQWFLFSGNSTLIKTEIGILNSISAPKSPKTLHTGPLRNEVSRWSNNIIYRTLVLMSILARSLS